MNQEHNIPLTAAETGSLWTQYMSDSMARCVFRQFLEKLDDNQIRPVIEYAKSLSEQHLQKISALYRKENIPVPMGFTESDVDLNAPRLYADPFFLSYVRNMGRIGMQRYALALSTVSRADVRKFYQDCIAESVQLDNKATEVQQSKGLYVRSPYIPNPEKIEFVKSSGFVGSLLGDKRPLSAVEIDHLFTNAQSNITGKTLLIGFSQIAQSKQVRDYMLRGMELAHKHIEVLSDILIKDDLPAPMRLESYVTASTVPPYSDKLMLYHTLALNSAGIGNYGVSLSLSMRTDISATYTRLMAEVLQYAEDGIHLFIKNDWMEQPPQAADRRALALSR